jgi:hypothetical protein
MPALILTRARVFRWEQHTPLGSNEPMHGPAYLLAVIEHRANQIVTRIPTIR